MFDISIIIPVYNVADTIERCARSLFSQTKDNIEYIFINDCTPDNSVALLKNVLSEYPHIEDNVIIINLEKNSGQGTARKIGLSKARGNYIAFCDSDDWLETSCYEKMFKSATENDSDIVICDYYEEYKNNNVVHHEKIISSDPRTAIRDSYRNYFKLFFWNKLLKKSIIDNAQLEMDDGINVWEDELFLVQFFLKSNKLSQVAEPLYHYNKANVKSTTRVIKDSQIPQLLYVTKKLSDLYDASKSFEGVKDFLRFRCRIIVVRDKWSDLNLYRKTYPDSGVYYNSYDLSAFSKLGCIRIWLLRHHLAFLCIFLNKLRS